jgi:hypothetical protein
MTAQRIARIGDSISGTCPLHGNEEVTGTWVSGGSTRVFCDGEPIIIVHLSIGNLTCGHHATPATGSGLAGTTEGAIHREGDLAYVTEAGPGQNTLVTVSGSNTTDSL